jgi:hypothetical protein
MNAAKLKREEKKRFNKWGERQPIVCGDRQKISAAVEGLFTRRDITEAEKSTKYYFNMTGCKGFEFVVFSNANITSPICLTDNVILYPCFSKRKDSSIIPSPATQASEIMEITTRYIYDGWIPIDDMSEEGIRNKIRSIREALSAFSLVTTSNFEWQPKYQLNKLADSLYPSKEHLETINGFMKLIDNMNPTDRKELLHSIGWLSQSIYQKNTESQFLFAVLAIESLSNYIDERSNAQSVFYSLKGKQMNKAGKKMARELCIKTTLEELLDRNATKAIETAYFNCVGGIKSRLREHLERIMGANAEGVHLFFYKTKGRMSLYDLRNTIAHGTHDPLSDEDLTRIEDSTFEIQDLAKRYIWTILGKIFDLHNKDETEMISFDPNIIDGLVSERSEYRDYTDMGLFYTLPLQFTTPPAPPE